MIALRPQLRIVLGRVLVANTVVPRRTELHERNWI
jgi:hypothetical protein